MELTSRRQIERMAAKGQFEAAESAQERNRECRHQQAVALRRHIEEQQAAEWLAFNRARRQVAVEARRENGLRKERQLSTATAHLEELKDEHDEDFKLYVAREETLLMRRPVAHSQRYVGLKRDARQMSQQHRYIEAGELDALATHVAAAEVEEAAAERARQLSQRVRKREDLLLGKERNAMRNLHAKVLLDDLHAGRENDTVSARMYRMQHSMAAMHEQQHRELDTVGRIRGGGGAPYCTATRGTRLEQRIATEQEKLPSLCRLYGHLL